MAPSPRNDPIGYLRWLSRPCPSAFRPNLVVGIRGALARFDELEAENTRLAIRVLELENAAWWFGRTAP